MELRTLTYFIAVAEELNITHAARRLNMSQPPLSSQMKGLEEELGVILFTRGKRHLELTEAGTVLYRRALQIVDLAEKTVEEVSGLGEGVRGTISIGITEGRAPFFTARYIAGFKEEFPDVKYNLWNGSSDDVIERLFNGLADLIMIAAPFDNEKMDSILVGREPWVAMIPRDHPLARLPGDKIPLSMLKDVPLIVPARKSRISAIRNWFTEINSEPNILCEMSNYLDAIALTEQGIGISIFPQTTYTPNDFVISKIITQSERKVEYYLCWPRGQRLSHAAREFINYASDFSEDNTNAILPTNAYKPESHVKDL